MTWKPDVCIYHGGCNDGFGAAWAVWKKWGDEVEFVPGNFGHGQPLDVDIEGKHVLFVDFSLKADVMHWAGKVARSVVVLDHHKTAKEELRPFLLSLGEDGSGVTLLSLLEDLDTCVLPVLREMRKPPVVAVFDMEKSGARLAWEFCHRDELHELLRYVEDRDLWRFEFGVATHRIAAALDAYPHDFAVWSELASHVSTLVDEGEILLRAKRKLVEECCENAYEETIAGHVVPVVNVPYQIASDCGHHLLTTWPDAPFAGTWSRLQDGRRQFSLRSTNERLDVSEIAKLFGGGGHRNAAGFSVSGFPFAA